MARGDQKQVTIVPDQGKIKKKKLDYKTSQEMETFSCAREFEELKAARTIIDQTNGPPVSRNLLTLGSWHVHHANFLPQMVQWIITLRSTLRFHQSVHHGVTTGADN